MRIVFLSMLKNCSIRHAHFTRSSLYNAKLRSGDHKEGQPADRSSYDHCPTSPACAKGETRSHSGQDVSSRMQFFKHSGSLCSEISSMIYNDTNQIQKEEVLNLTCVCILYLLLPIYLMLGLISKIFFKTIQDKCRHLVHKCHCCRKVDKRIGD